MGKTTIENTINKELIEFAKKHPIIEAIYQGIDMEDFHENFDSSETPQIVYYFLAPGKININLTNKIAELDLKLFPDSPITLMRIPVSLEQARYHLYLQKLIWQREKRK